MTQLGKAILPLLLAAAALLPASPAAAYDQPAVNLGATSFMDGAPPSGPGLYLQQYFQYYRSDRLQQFGAPSTEVDVRASLTQFVYQSDTPLLLGGKWGLNLIIPLVDFDLDGAPPGMEANTGGLGDVVLGPFLQWDPVMGPDGPRFFQRVELQLLLPTGRYDEQKALNPGSNVFSFNPYWAGTYFFTPQWTASWRLHYLWNAKNDDPNIPVPGIDDTQAGQAVHANFASAYEVIPQELRLGLNGYAFSQITDSEIDGDRVEGREQVVALGPGLLWHLSHDTHFFANAYGEFAGRYRPEGKRFNVRLVHHF